MKPNLKFKVDRQKHMLWMYSARGSEPTRRRILFEKNPDGDWIPLPAHVRTLSAGTVTLITRLFNDKMRIQGR